MMIFTPSQMHTVGFLQFEKKFSLCVVYSVFCCINCYSGWTRSWWTERHRACWPPWPSWTNH